MNANLYDLPRVKNEDAEGIDIEVIKKNLPKIQYMQFCNWFGGKTGGVTKNGKYFIFIWDWERFLEQELGILHA